MPFVSLGCGFRRVTQLLLTMQCLPLNARMISSRSRASMVSCTSFTQALERFPCLVELPWRSFDVHCSNDQVCDENRLRLNRRPRMLWVEAGAIRQKVRTSSTTCSNAAMARLAASSAAACLAAATARSFREGGQCGAGGMRAGHPPPMPCADHALGRTKLTTQERWSECLATNA